MQRVNRSLLINKAKQLLSDGIAGRVMGWKKGEFDYDVTPYVFKSADEIETDFVWGDFCGANFSKYLIKETQKSDEKIAVFLKPCDTYSFNQLLTEHRFEREKVYVIGVQCSGMADIRKIKNIAGEGISKIEECDGYLNIYTIYGEKPIKIDKNDALAERCLCCKSKRHVVYDELLGDAEEGPGADRFTKVKELEEMTEEQRYAFWRGELSRCIRCNACRDVCPACTCEKCVFDNPLSGLENKSPANEFEEKLFHIIRAFHVAGRCTDCGECSRVCPQQIPLHLLNRKFIKDINTFYGEYQAGETVGSRAPLVDYKADDREP